MRTIFSFLIFSFLISYNIFPQYTSRDSELVKTTFRREFNHQIILQYLNSKDDQKVNSALLSIAQSEDTSWVKEILNLKFQKFGDNICFSLGELGQCSTSANFLIKQILDKNNSHHLIHSALEALGKIGGNNSFIFITNYYFKNHSADLNGISLALYNFSIRNIGDKDITYKILLNELTTFDKPSQRNYEAVFALFRTYFPSDSKDIFIKELKDFVELKFSRNSYTLNTIPYLLNCLKKLKYFPADFQLFNSLIKSNNFDIKVAAANSLINYPYKTKQELDKYLILLNDPNSNVARSAAVSIKEIKLHQELMNYLHNSLKIKLYSNKLEKNTQGELFNSYIKLFKINFEESMEFEKIIPQEYFYQVLGNYNYSHIALNFLINKFTSANNKEKIILLESALQFQNKIGDDSELRNFIVKNIDSDFPPLIATAADGIDSISIAKEKESLSSIILNQVKKYYNNPDFQESIMSLAMLSQKIGNSFYKNVLNQLAKSDFYPIKKFAYKLQDKSTLHLINTDKNFENFWSNAFRYKKAEVKTSKGNFTIEFLPQFAPISVGNFCYLTEQKFFDNNSFHRVVPGFVIQGGDPEETGWGGPEYDIVSEFSPLNYDAGIVGMASAGKDTEGSQWFVTTGSFPHLNGRYTIFGKVIKGLVIANKILQGNKIISINLIRN